MNIIRKDIRPGDVICVDGWITNTVDSLEWIDGHGPPSAKRPALRITGWRITRRERGDEEGSDHDGYGSTTVLWNDTDTKIELLARGKFPRTPHDAFAIYEKLRTEDP